MADDSTGQLVATPPKADETPTRPETAAIAPEVTGATDTAATPAEKTKPTAAGADATTAQPTHSSPEKTGATDTAGGESTTEKAKGTPSAKNGTPVQKNKSRQSTGGSEPKSSKKGKQKELHLDAQPGQLWLAVLKGYPEWPAIICDEALIPNNLQAKRPVSAIRLDGTWREDFLPGGKNVKERRYPVMFLGTNEFYWLVNTDLKPLNLDKVKQDVDNNNQGKKTKALWAAYEAAAQEPDLDYFKNLMEDHKKMMHEEQVKQEKLEAEKAEKEAEKAEKAAKKDKKEKRKSKGKAGDEDVDMEDAEDLDSGKKAKSSKKRKKEADSDEEMAEKPAKTPKIKVKLGAAKVSSDDSAAKSKKPSKTKKVVKPKESDSDKSSPADEPITESERLAKRSKQVLWLRHKLQKGFLTRDQTPQEGEMSDMAGYFNQLDDLTELEPVIIKETKIHKVLKAILKLTSIPRDEDYHFKQRSSALLARWNKLLAGDVADTATNGVKHADEKTKSPEATAAATEEKKVDEPAKVAEKAPEPADAPAEVAKSSGEAKDGDVSMTDAPPADAPATTDSEAPAAEAVPEPATVSA